MFTVKTFPKAGLMLQTVFSNYLVNVGLNVCSGTKKVGKPG